jgi:hypothetical protein
MPNPLFSRYSQGENRVTASILAVFERISFALVERILQILCGDSNLPLLEIKNHIKPGKTGSVPDGAIRASFAYFIETKVVQNALWYGQLKEHLDYLNSLQNVARKKLLVLTPDYEQPEVIEQLNSDLIVWASFNDLYSAIVEITATDESWLTSNSSPPSEQERFLLRELVQMFLAEGLVNSGKVNSVLIVPAKYAIKDYRNFAAYICQPRRAFQRVEYMGFYHNGVIDKCIAKILVEPIEAVALTKDALEEANLTPETQGITPEVKKMFNELIDKLEKSCSGILGETLKVFFLSSSDSSETIKLTQDIRNNLKNAAGRPYAFTMGQRYVAMSALKRNPATTTELLAG